MRRLLPFVAAALALAGCGQPAATTTPASAAAPGAGKLLAIPGTHLLLVPPPGFALAKSFTGLENAAGTRLSVMDIMPNSYFRHADEYTRETLESRGVQVLDFQKTTISGYAARYAYVQTAEGQRIYQFMFGDSTFAAMAVGELAPGREQDGQALKQAVLTSKYDKKLKTDALASAPFRLDTIHSEFRFMQANAGMYVYALKGTASDAPNAPILTVMPVPADEGTTPEAMKELTLESLARNGLTNVEIRNPSTARVNGYDAYSADVYCEKEGKKAVFYELFLVHGAQAVTVQGVVPGANEAAAPAMLRQVRAFAQTITLR